MPKQDWNINTKPAYAGEQYGLATTNSQRLTYSTDAAMDTYGVAVQQGVASNTVKVGHDAGAILGITMRELKLESKTRPGDGTVLIPKGQPLGVMLEGAITVKLQTAITGKELGINPKGLFGAVASGTGDAVYTKATNVVALQYPAAAGDVIGVMINMTGPKP